MKTITSVSNLLVKQATELKQKKYRIQQDAFLVEGTRSVEEAVTYGYVLYAFIDEKRFVSPREKELLLKLEQQDIDIYSVSESILKKISDTESPQAIIAVVAKPKIGKADLEVLDGNILVLDGVSDPGNLGTMIRTADAAGVKGVILLTGCVDVFAPKTVRATMGSVFHLPVLELTHKEFIAWSHASNYKILATTLEGAQSVYDCDLKGKKAIVIGSEAVGVTKEILLEAQEKIFIPMEGNSESLNAAVASGIILFESLRQRLAGK